MGLGYLNQCRPVLGAHVKGVKWVQPWFNPPWIGPCEKSTSGAAVQEMRCSLSGCVKMCLATGTRHWKCKQVQKLVCCSHQVQPAGKLSLGADITENGEPFKWCSCTGNGMYLDLTLHHTNSINRSSIYTYTYSINSPYTYNHMATHMD